MSARDVFYATLTIVFVAITAVGRAPLRLAQPGRRFKP
jgi:hypothetical protein